MAADLICSAENVKLVMHYLLFVRVYDQVTPKSAKPGLVATCRASSPDIDARLRGARRSPGSAAATGHVNRSKRCSSVAGMNRVREA